MPGVESGERPVPLRRPQQGPASGPATHPAVDDNGAPLAIDSDRFIQREVIGRGGSGVVLRAFDRALRREVAIKVLDPASSDGAPEVDRFAEEARIAGQLEHPNIVPVYDFGVDHRGRRLLCMKYVQGITLEESLTRLGSSRLEPARLAELLQVFGKVCDAVSFAHSRGVIHRDLKPANVMISDFGQVYVLDWGIARRRRRGVAMGPRPPSGAGAEDVSELDPPGSLLGTACYIAPEQIQGRHDCIDERTDVFALGGTLYQILTGQPPLTPSIARSIWMRCEPASIPLPASVAPGDPVPPELARIALRALSYDPASRHSSVEDLKREVEGFLCGAWDLPRTRLPAGSVIVRQGEPGFSAYVLVEGRCVVYRADGGEETTLRDLGPGDVFGETAVFSGKPRTASVRAVTEVTLVVVTHDALAQALGLNTWMGAFVRALADRFREVDGRLRVLERTQ